MELERRGVVPFLIVTSTFLPLVRAQAKTLKLAVLLPRSGYLAPAGQSCHRGAVIAPHPSGPTLPGLVGGESPQPA